MHQKCDKLHPSAPLENNDLEQRLEKKLNDVNTFNNHINNIIEKSLTSKTKTINQRRFNKFRKHK